MIVAPGGVERAVLTDRFFAAGYKVAEADSIDEALRKVVRLRPRALVVDGVFLSPEALAPLTRLPTLLHVHFYLLLHELTPALTRAYFEAGAANLFLRRANTPHGIVRLVHKALSL
jgi:hypothetical protein